MDEINILINLDVKHKEIYIGEDNSSGCKYEYKNINDMLKKIKNYLIVYHSEVKENWNE